MLEIVKMLLEEANKIKRLLLFLVQILLTVFLAMWLFQKVIGPFKIINIMDASQWLQFVVSGQIFLVVFVYLVSYCLLFYVAQPLVAVISIGFLKGRPLKRIDNDMGRIIAFILRQGDYLNIDRHAKKIYLMERSDELYAIANAFTVKETKSEMRSYHHALINELFFHYVAFVVFYFTILNTIPHTTLLTVCLLSGIVVLLLTYLLIGATLEVMYKISPDLIRLVEGARLLHFLEEQLRKNGCFLFEPEPKNDHHKLFYFGLQQTAIFFDSDMHRINGRTMEREVEYATKNKMAVWLFTNQPIGKDARELLDANSDKVVLLQFSGEEDLAEKVKQQLAVIPDKADEF